MIAALCAIPVSHSGSIHRVRLEFVSSGASAEQNEDWGGSFQSSEHTDLVIIVGQAVPQYAGRSPR
jgi:hypothetical protein